jgi:hypothetical protein
MSLNPRWVPMKWACGPLEIERLKKANSGPKEFQKMAERWADPSSLELLKGSPVNCLVVEWAAGAVEDQEQQIALKELIREGKQRGLSFVGHISAKENLLAIVASGRAAGLDAVIIEKSDTARLDLPVIFEFANDAMEWNEATEIFCATGAVWPGVNLETMSGNTAKGGPTGILWVNSNGWFSLLSHQIASGKIPWLDSAPPASPKAVPALEYCRAIADSRMYGSRWIVSLDLQLRTALLNQDAEAEQTWAEIGQTLAFFETHADWEGYNPLAALAVVSDFVGQNAFFSGEVLNLLNRHQTQFLVADRLRMKAAPGTGLKGIIWMDDTEPDAAQRGWLLDFVRAGGVVIASKYWGPEAVPSTKEDWLPEYVIYPVEEGRIVVATGGLPDSYQLANDAHLLIGRKNDFARLFNPETTNCYSSIRSDGRQQTVQVVNYGRRPVEYISLWVNAKAKSGMLVSPELKSPMSLQCFPSGNGTEFHLPTLRVNCAVEIERLV